MEYPTPENNTSGGAFHRMFVFEDAVFIRILFRSPTCYDQISFVSMQVELTVA